MAKNHNRKPSKHNDPMGLATTVFLAGCFSELYLLMIRRYYVNGTLAQVIGWNTALPYIGIAGLVLLAVGIVLALKWKQDNKKRSYGWWTAGIGAFLAAASFLVYLNMASLVFLTTLVPVVMLLVLVWLLYDQESALTLTVLGSALVMLWLCRHLASAVTLMGTVVKVVGIAYILLLVALVVIAKKHKLPFGLSISSPTSVYVGSALGIVTVAISLFSASLAYYAMWALAAVIFAVAVYYTVKQL